MTTLTTKPVVLLIPGMLNNARIWGRVAPLLTDVADVRIADVASQSRIEDMARDAWSLVADVPASQRLVVCGFSMGGYVALDLIATYLIAKRPIDTWAIGLFNTSSRMETSETLLAREKTIRAIERDFDRVIKGIAPFGIDAANHGDAVLMAEALAIMRETGADAAVRQLRAIMARPDQGPLLQQIQAPTLIVSSRSDQVVPPAASEEMAAAIPHARLEWIGGAGHMTPLEQPGVLANLLKALL